MMALCDNATWHLRQCDMAPATVRHGTCDNATWYLRQCDIISATRHLRQCDNAPATMRHGTCDNATWYLRQCDMISTTRHLLLACSRVMCVCLCVCVIFISPEVIFILSFLDCWGYFCHYGIPFIYYPFKNAWTILPHMDTFCLFCCCYFSICLFSDFLFVRVIFALELISCTCHSLFFS